MRTLIMLMSLISLGSFCMKKKSAELHNSEDHYEEQRLNMVRTQIKSRGVQDPKVLEAMTKVPRHLFVPPGEIAAAYADTPLSIGHRQTISQPYIVAYMTEKLELSGDERVLEIGTGSGYQAAVLSELARKVYTIEIVEPLCRSARARLEQLNYSNVQVKCGDGTAGWPEHAPFDAVIVTAAPQSIPQPLVDQLAVGGRMILPVGKFFQELMLIKRNPDGKIEKESLIPVRFVPMTGEADGK